MFINEEQINFKDFQNMCRTCLKNNDLKSIKNNFLIEVLHNITDINYRIDEELPQNICDTCIKKIHEIQAFAFQCIEIDITLRKCRNAVEKPLETAENIKQETPEIDVKESHIQFNEIEDVTFDENVIDIDVDDKPKCGNFEKWFQKSTDINYSFATFAAKDESDSDSDNSTNLIIENEEPPPKKPAKLPPIKSFQCETCHKCFKSKNAIKRHRDLFKGRHFCCDICSQIFTNSSGLKMHKKKHKFIGILVCDLCNKLFYKARALRDHKKKVHQV